MFYVEFQNGKISGKGNGPAINEEQKEITEEVYKQLTVLPAEYTEDENGNIISVVCPPKPEPKNIIRIDTEKVAMQAEIEELKNRLSALETKVITEFAVK